MAQENSAIEVQEMVERYLEIGQISYQQYQQLAQAMLADEQIDETERDYIDRLFKAIRSGRLRVIT